MSLVYRGVSHRFGDVMAADRVDLEAVRGEITCLFGPSGCGKTTLLRLAAGLEDLQNGAIDLDGEPLGRTPPERRPVGMVFQDYVLFPHMTVEKNVAFGLTGVKNVKAAIAEQLRALHIGDLAARYPHELSGGQQQRVALARALVREPKALLLDEPFASIDAVLRRTLREDLRRILKERSVAVVLVTHDPEEALALGDRIALMRSGRIVEHATPEELFHRPQTPDGAQIFPGSQMVEGAIRNGRLVTPVGDFDAGGLADGPGVAVIREGALSAQRDSSGAWTVVDCRFAGPGWAWYLAAEAQGGVLRVAADAPCEPGEKAALTCRGEGVFCYQKQ